MKLSVSVVAVMSFAFILVACGGKKESDTIIATKIEKKQITAPVRMQDYTQTREVEWEGGTLTCRILREADDSLAMVTDETGQKFVDNRVELSIKRADGSVFLEKTFTKATFDKYIDDSYRNAGILEGFVFDCVDGRNLRFAASVSHPQTDEYIPLIVFVSHNGTISIERDTQLDTNADADE